MNKEQKMLNSFSHRQLNGLLKNYRLWSIVRVYYYVLKNDALWQRCKRTIINVEKRFSRLRSAVNKLKNFFPSAEVQLLIENLGFTLSARI